jgi:hypothetical protein
MLYDIQYNKGDEMNDIEITGTIKDISDGMKMEFKSFRGNNLSYNVSLTLIGRDKRLTINVPVRELEKIVRVLSELPS